MKKLFNHITASVYLVLALGTLSGYSHAVNEIASGKFVRVANDSNMPRTILVLPPLNDSNEPAGSYAYLSTVSKPLAAAGYYVYPVAVIDAFLKENGLPTPYEMHSAQLDKIRDVLGAEAVLYLHLRNYGQHYNVISSDTVVSIEARLVDTQTGETLWQRDISERNGSSSNGDGLEAHLINAIVSQVIDSSSDSAHKLTREVNEKLFSKHYGLPRGPSELKSIEP